MLLQSLDIVDAPTRRAFACITGPVWQLYTQATRRSRERRLTAVFESDAQHRFQALLFVGCDFLRRGSPHCRPLWTAPGWQVDDATAQALCIGHAGRSVLRPAEVPGLVGPPVHAPRSADPADEADALAALATPCPSPRYPLATPWRPAAAP
ncbi:hypothetical protein ISF6_5293 [Piscinibacter sakaiensis]|uniref:Uncharacterized protein n=2 Tax=Piscinibacter sakaiensis TaxID=1547922 RepID=A0A0K8P972_PISS1|nr:hypothetical protein ISF6_5293 [Piscinibacter sakaiensis]